ATCFVVALVLLLMSEVSSLSCIKCAPDVKCPTLPDDCQPTTRPCGCCRECKGKVGARCSNFGLTCESGLMCVNKLGPA
ncbi:hypothetical protein GH877_30845, partial [Bacillus thuringiensis]|nr:hypothetical protein [Bacillus thuringiensis]